MKFLCALIAAVVLLCVSQARAAVVYDQIAVQDGLGNTIIVNQPRFVPDSVAYQLSLPAFDGYGGFNGVGFHNFGGRFIDPRFQHFDRFGNVRFNNFRRW